MIYHMTAFLAGFLLDLLFGDPHWLPHPVRWMGRGIRFLEKGLLRKEASSGRKRRAGALLVLIMAVCTLACTAVILVGGYLIHPVLGVVFESIMTYQILATKCLRVESMKVYHSLKEESLEQARYAVSMIVGRDTDALDETGVAKAAVETVAENTSDGVIAPLIYTAIGGPILGFLYKVINTMDSMVGYKNDRYLDFGRWAAKTDDAVNYLPSRISALLMMAACGFLGNQFSGRDAFRIWRRDSRNHTSPNSAQTESVCAGALGIMLGGDAFYFGKKVSKPTIGDDLRPIQVEDIKKSNALMYVTAFLAELLGLACMLPMIMC